MATVNGNGGAAKGAAKGAKGAAAAASAAKGGGFAKWYATHKPEALIGGAGLVVAIAAYVRSKQNAAAAAAGTSSTATPSTSTVMPGTTAPYSGSYGSGGGDVTGIESLLSQLSGQVTALQGAQGSQTGAGSAGASASPSTTPTNFGQGIVQTAEGPMVWLGVTGAGGSTAGDFQVGGGAPVYFGNAGALAQGGTKSAGVDVYTPTAYENLVSQKAGA